MLSNAGERVLYVTGLTIVARQDSHVERLNCCKIPISLKFHFAAQSV